MEFVHGISAQIHLGFQFIPPFQLFAIKILIYAHRTYRLKDFMQITFCHFLSFYTNIKFYRVGGRRGVPEQ